MTLSDPFTVVLFNDMHIGSDVALWLPDAPLNNKGNTLGMNEGQRRIYDFYEESVEWIVSLEPDLLLTGGDLVQGTNYRNYGAEVIPCDIDAQKDVAVSLIQMFRKHYPKIPCFGVDSTHYHNSRDTKVDKYIVEQLGGEHTGSVFNVTLHKAHKLFLHLEHGSSSAFVYREGMIGRKKLFADVAHAQGKIPKVNISIYCHLHWFYECGYEDSKWMISPAWQAQTTWAAGKQWERYQPTIGFIAIQIEDEENIIIRKRLMKNIPHIADKIWDLY